jgi:hypothetical protein
MHADCSASSRSSCAALIAASSSGWKSTRHLATCSVGQSRNVSATSAPLSKASGRDPGCSTGRAIQPAPPVSIGSTSSP